MQSMYVFVDIRKFADFRSKNAGVSRTQRVCHVSDMFFGSSLIQVRYNCAKFRHCRICVTNFKEEGPFWPPIREQLRKCPS